MNAAARTETRPAAVAIGARDRFGEEAVGFALRLALIGGMGILLAVFTEGFLSAANILNVLRQASLIFLLASGLTLVILSGGFDLSVASNLTLAAC